MKLMVVSAVVVALLALASGYAVADISRSRPHGPSAFPRYDDPWQYWGRPHPRHDHPRPHPPRFQVPHSYVWIPAQWSWNGWHWVWVPGHWRWR